MGGKIAEMAQSAKEAVGLGGEKPQWGLKRLIPDLYV